MCCFAGPVKSVSNTQIFARLTDEGSQFLVYRMQFASEVDNAMMLPLPWRRPRARMPSGSSI